jgi:hypothetical protein
LYRHNEVAEAIAERVAECGGSAAYPTRSYPSRDTKRAALVGLYALRSVYQWRASIWFQPLNL